MHESFVEMEMKVQAFIVDEAISKASGVFLFYFISPIS